MASPRPPSLAQASHYRLPELLHDIRLLDLLELCGTTVQTSRLGQAFRIGHSTVTPHQSLDGRSTRDWFAEVVASELKPLLQEYWFDAPEQAAREAEGLLEGW